MTKNPRCLVIDTDIARSAGGLDAQEGRSKSCRDFLTAILEETDHKVVTDEIVRHCFREAAQTIGVMKPIVWVNPCKNEETPFAWLLNGVPIEKERQLGHQ